MSIHIAPFNGNHQNIIQFDRNHPSAQILLISQEISKEKSEFQEGITRLEQYCALVDISKPIIEYIPDLSTTDFYELTLICTKIIDKYTKSESLFLNLGCGSVSLNTALIYSAHLLSQIKETNIEISITETINEAEKTIPLYQKLHMEYNPPSTIEFTILSGVKSQLNVTEIATSLKYSPASISLKSGSIFTISFLCLAITSAVTSALFLWLE